jgi:hypothetical protein
MKRAFGTEISGNRGPEGELSRDARAGILSAVEHGVPKSQIASEYGIDRRTIYKTIECWKLSAGMITQPQNLYLGVAILGNSIVFKSVCLFVMCAAFPRPSTKRSNISSKESPTGGQSSDPN